jgi:hypothetical protein
LRKQQIWRIAPHWTAYRLRGATEDFWAAEHLSDSIAEDPVAAWAIIEAVLSMVVDDTPWREAVDAALGGGPLEGLLVLHGESIIDCVVTSAADTARLRYALSCVDVSQLSCAMRHKVEQLHLLDRDN